MGEGSSQRSLTLHPSVGVGLGKVVIEPLDQAIIEIHSMPYFILSFNGKGMGRIGKLETKNQELGK